ncbi:MAG TPA: S41 family peptidase [Anaerolineaceae bacterium]
MKTKVTTTALIGFMAIILLMGTFSGGLLVGWNLPHQSRTAILSTPVAGASTAVPAKTTDRDSLFKPFWQAWDLVHDQFVDQPVNDEELMRGAIRGMLGALKDQHTSYMDPDQYRQQNTPLKGEYEGIGAWVDITGEYLKIISPMPNSPAEKAGLKAGDTIVAVDGEDMTGIDGNLVLRRILGPAGTKVTITIRRGGTDTKPFDVEITRAKITVPTVEGKMLENKIAYVQLFNYGEKTTADLRKTLKDLMAQKPNGMILDLRNNGGGYLDTAIEVTSEFIAKGVIMYEVYGTGKRDTYNAKSGGLATNIPLVVLVNEGTASASEITAGAIQDYGRGQLVGTTTYGKGSVQNWVPLTNDQGAVRVTIARWLTPKERQIHKVGLKPDVVVELTEEDIKAERDPQLDKAIELLTKK